MSSVKVNRASRILAIVQVWLRAGELVNDTIHSLCGRDVKHERLPKKVMAVAPQHGVICSWLCSLSASQNNYVFDWTLVPCWFASFYV